jgi:hypothetical protein
MVAVLFLKSVNFYLKEKHMDYKRFIQIEHWMEKLPVAHALHWCNGGPCACMGYANGSGGLAAKGVTKEEWSEWWELVGISKVRPEEYRQRLGIPKGKIGMVKMKYGEVTDIQWS